MVFVLCKVWFIYQYICVVVVEMRFKREREICDDVSFVYFCLPNSPFIERGRIGI